MVVSECFAQKRPSLSILTPEFSVALSAFNELTRDLRNSGVEVIGLQLDDNRIVIKPESVDLLSRRFGHELRAMCQTTAGRRTRTTATMRGVEVSWFSRVKEQDQ